MQLDYYIALRLIVNASFPMHALIYVIVIDVESKTVLHIGQVYTNARVSFIKQHSSRNHVNKSHTHMPILDLKTQFWPACLPNHNCMARD